MWFLTPPRPPRHPFTATCPCGASVDTEFLTANDHHEFSMRWLLYHGDHRDAQVGQCERFVDGPGGPLDCTLLSGHAGRHQDRSGATWTP